MFVGTQGSRAAPLLNPKPPRWSRTVATAVIKSGRTGVRSVTSAFESGRSGVRSAVEWWKSEEEEEARRLATLRRRQQVVSCCKSFIAFLFSHVGLAGMVVAYSIMGGFLFQAIEAPHELHTSEDEKRALWAFKEDRLDEIVTLLKQDPDVNVKDDVNLTNLTQHIRLIFVHIQERVTVAVKNNGWDGKDTMDADSQQWSFAGALLYAVTVITTIGYGHIAPKTVPGRLLTIIYAIIGIPLTFLYLSNIGNFLADCFRLFYKRICRDICLCQKCERNRRLKRQLLRRRQLVSSAQAPHLDDTKYPELHKDGLAEIKYEAHLNGVCGREFFSASNDIEKCIKYDAEQLNKPQDQSSYFSTPLITLNDSVIFSIDDKNAREVLNKKHTSDDGPMSSPILIVPSRDNTGYQSCDDQGLSPLAALLMRDLPETDISDDDVNYIILSSAIYCLLTKAKETDIVSLDDVMNDVTDDADIGKFNCFNTSVELSTQDKSLGSTTSDGERSSDRTGSLGILGDRVSEQSQAAAILKDFRTENNSLDDRNDCYQKENELNITATADGYATLTLPRTVTSASLPASSDGKCLSVTPSSTHVIKRHSVGFYDAPNEQEKSTRDENTHRRYSEKTSDAGPRLLSTLGPGNRDQAEAEITSCLRETQPFRSRWFSVQRFVAAFGHQMHRSLAGGAEQSKSCNDDKSADVEFGNKRHSMGLTSEPTMKERRLRRTNTLPSSGAKALSGGPNHISRLRRMGVPSHITSHNHIDSHTGVGSHMIDVTADVCRGSRRSGEGPLVRSQTVRRKHGVVRRHVTNAGEYQYLRESANIGHGQRLQGLRSVEDDHSARTSLERRRRTSSENRNESLECHVRRHNSDDMTSRRDRWVELNHRLRSGDEDRAVQIDISDHSKERWPNQNRVNNNNNTNHINDCAKNKLSRNWSSTENGAYVASGLTCDLQPHHPRNLDAMDAEREHVGLPNNRLFLSPDHSCLENSMRRYSGSSCSNALNTAIDEQNDEKDAQKLRNNGVESLTAGSTLSFNSYTHLSSKSLEASRCDDSVFSPEKKTASGFVSHSSQHGDGDYSPINFQFRLDPPEDDEFEEGMTQYQYDDAYPKFDDDDVVYDGDDMLAFVDDPFNYDRDVIDHDGDDDDDERNVTVPIWICLGLICGYVFAGSVLFTVWEDWDLFTGSYFCFITLSTIGFGDIVPGTDMTEWASHEKLVLCALWLAFGLSLLAMCFNLMQEEVRDKFRRLGRKMGLLKDDGER